MSIYKKKIQYKIEIRVLNKTILRQLISAIIVLILLILFPAILLGNEPILLNDNQDNYTVGKHLDILEDKDGTMSFEKISSQEYGEKFIKSIWDVPNFGYTDSAYWVKFTLDGKNLRTEKMNLIIEVSYSLLDYVYMYAPDSKGNYYVSKTGDRLKFSSREIDHRFFLFKIDMKPREKKTIYLRVKSESSVQIHLHLWTETAFAAKDHNEQYALGIYYGIILVMMLYNLFLFFSVKHKSYLYYVLYIISFGFLLMFLNGTGYEYIWPNWIWWANSGVPIMIGIVGFNIVLFTMSLLNTKEMIPRFHIVLRILLGFMILLIVLAFVTPYQFAIKFGYVYTIFIPIILIITGFLCVLKKYPPAMYYLIAWTMLLLGMSAYALKAAGILEKIFITEYGIQIGSALEVILLSLALGDRINLERRDKIKAQEIALEKEIIARKAQDEALVNKQLAIENLIKADKLKDEFLANTSHELRTPLNGINGLAESLLNGIAGPINEKMRNDLIMIASSGRRLSSLINDILDFSKLKNRDISINKKAVDLYSVVKMVLLLSEPLISSKKIILINNVDKNFGVVLADENRLEQILHNLIGNAIKFTDEGTIEISSKIEGNSNQPYARIIVSDTGIGIPLDKHETIFRSFEQVDGTIEKEYYGTGLGLTITRKLVELHGGNISVESMQGVGSIFTFTIPMADEEITKTGNNNSFLKSFKPDFKEKKSITYLNQENIEIVKDFTVNNFDLDYLNSSISESDIVDNEDRKPELLIVDDDAINLQVLENNLALYNYSITKATNGYEALELIESGKEFDLVLLDVMMPRMSGYEVCSKIREKYSPGELPVVLLTAKNLVSDLVKGFESGTNDYLAKPFDKRELLARVQTLISLKDAVKETSKLIALQKDLEIAKQIQEAIIPQSVPTIDGLGIASCYIPMEQIGGDFYDVLVLDENRVGILMVDVAGHGVSAALIASMVKIVFYMLKDHAHIPSQFMEKMNNVLTSNMRKQFLTAQYAIVDLKNMSLSVASAGHIPLYIYRGKNNDLIECAPKGRIIGWMNDQTYIQEEVNIEKGDRILLLTDGITEASNEKEDWYNSIDETFYGKLELFNFIKRNRNLNNEKFIGDLLKDLENWTGDINFEDDITMMVVDVDE